MKDSVNVMGVTYTITGRSQKQDIKLDEGCLLGYCDYTTKEIIYATHPNSVDVFACKDLSYIEKKTVRHEIIHAFLYESGLDNDSNSADAWGINEEMVDWLAIQFSKILKAFEDVGCL